MAYNSLFADAFTRADSATVGNGWVEDNAAVFEILSNACKATGNAAGFAANIMRAPASANFVDGKAVVEFTHTAGAVPQLYLRLAAAAASGYLVYWNTTLRLSKITTGTLVDLDTQTYALAVGTNYRLTFEIQGNNKTVVLHDMDAVSDVVTLTDSADSTYTSSGYTALSIHDSGTATYDNFESFELLPATITSDAIKNYSGTIRASETGWIANVYNTTTGALVVRKTGLSTDASGIITFNDAAMATGTSYRVDFDDGAGNFGSKEYTAT